MYVAKVNNNVLNKSDRSDTYMYNIRPIIIIYIQFLYTRIIIGL